MTTPRTNQKGQARVLAVMRWLGPNYSQMKNTKKLYRVTLRGFGGFTTGVDYKLSYVVADDAEAAYRAVRSKLDKADYGFTKDRELAKVELLAEDYDYTDTQTRLFCPNK
jgi:hypothetical protein